MSQPNWKLEWASDCEALYVDTTGVYAPELETLHEVFDAPKESSFLVFRACLDRCKVVEGILVPFIYQADWTHPLESYREWYAEDLPSVASSCGYDDDGVSIIEGLCSENPTVRARAYSDIAAHHGWMNFDQYPLTISETQADGWPDWRDVPETEDTDGAETPESEDDDG